MTSFFSPIGLSGENAFSPRTSDFFPSEQATAALRKPGSAIPTKQHG
jgi:hypothetical protein